MIAKTRSPTSAEYVYPWKVHLITILEYLINNKDKLLGIIMVGINRLDENKLLRYICFKLNKEMCLTFSDDDGIIISVDIDYNIGKSINNKRIPNCKISTRIIQAIVNIIYNIGSLSIINDKNDTFDNIKTYNIDLNENLNPGNIVNICNRLLNAAKVRNNEKANIKSKTVVWIPLCQFIKMPTETLPYGIDLPIGASNNDNNNNQDKDNNISNYRYDRKDIAAIDAYFLYPSSRKIRCLNSNHVDIHPSMVLYKNEIDVSSKFKEYKLTCKDIAALYSMEKESNIASYDGINFILFWISAHCFSCNFHLKLLTNSQIKTILSTYYI
uniref:Wsv137-like protein n=1 Tax=Trachysalambria curvirostris majanivirus TaxID=2984281 RepID=A0A9C7CDZ5_9VIRU|nr:MAG: wsv137-like protein [Trachysalambria curvirostris majanivirus]